LVGVDRREQALTGDQTLARPQQLAEDAALLLRAVPENRVHLDAWLHEHHAAGFADGRFARVEFHLDKLHFSAFDFVINNIHGHGGFLLTVFSTKRALWRDLMHAAVTMCV